MTCLCTGTPPCWVCATPPEPEVMSAENYEALMTPTDPDACTCRHGGLPLAWHREFCALMPDRRPFVPPTPETPAERAQGEAGEVAE